MKRKKLRTLKGIDHSKEDFLSAINFDEEKREEAQEYINVLANQIFRGEIKKSEAFQKICEEMSIEELGVHVMLFIIDQINQTVSRELNPFEEKEDRSDDKLDEFLDKNI